MKVAKKLVVILGPTATGKSALAVKLAKKFKGEIVSADSRQVYKGLDIGTGKITKKEQQGIPHYLLDAASPRLRFTVAQYQKMAYQAIDKILGKGKLPFLVGGSPLYLYAVIDGWQFPRFKPNWTLRKKLAAKTADQLFAWLKKLDPQRAATIEPKNKRRLSRAIEIAKNLGQVPRLKKIPRYNCLLLGLNLPKQKLQQKIKKRLLARLKRGLIKEVIRLKQKGVRPHLSRGLSWSRIEGLGLEYYWVAQFLQNKISKPEMVLKLEKAIWDFARRQMTWFKKDRRIKWVRGYSKASKEIGK